MQEKESLMIVLCELKISSFWISVPHHSAILVMPNSYLRDRIFSPHLTTIKDSYILDSDLITLEFIMSPTEGKGGHTVFVADPVGVGVALSCMSDIS